MVGHVMGLPVEESVLTLATSVGAMMTAVAIAGRTGLSRLRRGLHRRSTGEDNQRI
jgi:hypothetical protein